MKTLYVPKGKTLHYERLECQTIIADGTLVVDGAVRAKRITGKGLLDAGSVYSPAVSVRDLDTVKVVCDLLAAEYVRAVEVIVSSSAVVSRYLEAEYVEARKLTVSKHQISELRVEEYLSVGKKAGCDRRPAVWLLPQIMAVCEAPHPDQHALQAVIPKCERGKRREGGWYHRSSRSHRSGQGRRSHPAGSGADESVPGQSGKG